MRSLNLYTTFFFVLLYYLYDFRIQCQLHLICQSNDPSIVKCQSGTQSFWKIECKTMHCNRYTTWCKRGRGSNLKHGVILWNVTCQYNIKTGLYNCKQGCKSVIALERIQWNIWSIANTYSTSNTRSCIIRSSCKKGSNTDRIVLWEAIKKLNLS